MIFVVVKYGNEDKKNKWNHSQWTNVESTAVDCLYTLAKEYKYEKPVQASCLRVFL